MNFQFFKKTILHIKIKRNERSSFIPFLFFLVIFSNQILNNKYSFIYFNNKFKKINNLDYINNTYFSMTKSNFNLKLLLISNFLKPHIKFNLYTINYLSKLSWPSKENQKLKKVKLASKKKKEIMLEKFQRLSKKKKKLFKKINSQRKYYDLKRKNIILKYKNLSIYSSIGIFISYITAYIKKNRRKYKDIKNYQLGILIESTKTLFFKILKLSNLYTNIENTTFIILLYGYRSLFYSFLVKISKIKDFSGLNLLIGCTPKLSFKLSFSRKKHKSIKKRLKKNFKYFI